jgi:Ca2+-binding EF-hand superfamily protein
MKKVWIIFCICLALAFVSGCASSGGGVSSGKDENLFEKYDRDSDGKISKEEYNDSDLSKGSNSVSFESADKNEDGFLDQDEFDSSFRGGRR